MVKTEFPPERWDKKKIIMAIFILLGLIIGGFELKTYVLGSKDLNSNFQSDVKGSRVFPSTIIAFPSAQSIGEEALGNINNIKEEINNINVQDLATSSPQVKKILDDIKSLPNYPASQAREVCLNFCNGL